MRLVIIESPYAGDVDAHVAYARRAMLDCLRRGESPYASHLLLTQCLNDGIPGDRSLGIAAGLAWAERADCTVVYCDYGISDGMKQGIEHAAARGRPVLFRYIGANP